MNLPRLGILVLYLLHTTVNAILKVYTQKNKFILGKESRLNARRVDFVGKPQTPHILKNAFFRIGTCGLLEDKF